MVPSSTTPSTSAASSDAQPETDETNGTPRTATEVDSDGGDETTVEIDFPTPVPEVPRVRHRWPILALIVLTLGFYWHITRHIGGDLWPSDMMDGASFTWNMWYLPNQLLNGGNPFVTDDIFYPEGAKLGFHTYIPLIALLSWPLTQLFGYATTFTIVTLAGPALSGIGAYLLAFHLVRNRSAAMFAGAAYIMLPDRVLRMGGHVNLNHTEVLPFGLLMLLRFYDNPSRRNAIGLGAITGVSLLLESIFAAFLMMGFLMVMLIRWRETFTKRRISGWIIAALTGAVVAMPVLIPMITEVSNGELDPLPGWGAADGGSADLFSYVVPSAFHPIWGDTFAHAYSAATAGERFTFVGWTVLVLAAIGLLEWRGPYKKTLITMTGVFWVLSLGPFLHIAGRQGDKFEYLNTRFDVPLPFFAIHFVPILNGVRIPARFGLVVDLLLAVIAAFGLAWIFQRFATERRRWLPPIVSVVAIGMLAVECLPGGIPKMTSPVIPTPYDAIARDPGNSAVLELPLQWRDGFGQIGDSIARRDNTIFMYYAIHHEKPIVGGMVARYPDEKERRLQNIPVYRQVLALQGDIEAGPATFTSADLRALDIGYVVAHRDRPVPEAYEYMSSLDMPVMADDGTTIVWKVP